MADDLNSRSLGIIVIEVCALVVLNILSLAGNILVCMSVYRNVKLRTTTNLYIIALACSDLLSAIFVMPLSTGVLITGEWVFGRTVCQIHAFFVVFLLYVSPATMGLTAINRYVRMCRSDLHYKRLFSTVKSRVLLGSVWTFVACFVLAPRFTGFQDFDFVPAYAICVNIHLSKSGKTIHYCLVLLLFLITPLSVTIFSYVKVAKMIQKHNRGNVSTLRRQRGNSRVSSHEIKLSKSLFVVVFAFMVCWIPLWIIAIMKRFGLVVLPRSVQLLPSYFAFLSNAINPAIYAGMNPLFKREFRRILRCRNGETVVERRVPAALRTNTWTSISLSRSDLSQRKDNLVGIVELVSLKKNEHHPTSLDVPVNSTSQNHTHYSEFSAAVLQKEAET